MHVTRSLAVLIFFIVLRLTPLVLFLCFPLFLGIRIGLFTPDKAFDLVCREQIKNLREPCIKLADLVTHEMMSTFKEILTKVI